MPFAPAHLPPATSAACERSAPPPEHGRSYQRRGLATRNATRISRACLRETSAAAGDPVSARRQAAPRPSLRARTTIPWDRDK
jgi:hypothetical protein